jgi:hypothetical protein
VDVEERVGIAGDQPLRERCRLRQERPVPVGQRQAVVGSRPDLPGGHDVEHRERADPIRMVQSHPVGHAAATVMTGDGEAIEA